MFALCVVHIAVAVESGAINWHGLCVDGATHLTLSANAALLGQCVCAEHHDIG